MSSYLCDQYFAVLFDCFSFLPFCRLISLSSSYFILLCRPSILSVCVVCWFNRLFAFRFRKIFLLMSHVQRIATICDTTLLLQRNGVVGWVWVLGFFWRNCFLVLPLMLVFFCVGCEVLITNNIINWISVNGNISNDMLIIEISIREFSKGTSLKYF